MKTRRRTQRGGNAFLDSLKNALTRQDNQESKEGPRSFFSNILSSNNVSEADDAKKDLQRRIDKLRKKKEAIDNQLNQETMNETNKHTELNEQSTKVQMDITELESMLNKKPSVEMAIAPVPAYNPTAMDTLPAPEPMPEPIPEPLPEPLPEPPLRDTLGPAPSDLTEIRNPGDTLITPPETPKGGRRTRRSNKRRRRYGYSRRSSRRRRTRR